jgi:hypothetical protein
VSHAVAQQMIWHHTNVVNQTLAPQNCLRASVPGHSSVTVGLTPAASCPSVLGTRICPHQDSLDSAPSLFSLAERRRMTGYAQSAPRTRTASTGAPRQATPPASPSSTAGRVRIVSGSAARGLRAVTALAVSSRAQRLHAPHIQACLRAEHRASGVLCANLMWCDVTASAVPKAGFQPSANPAGVEPCPPGTAKATAGTQLCVRCTGGSWCSKSISLPADQRHQRCWEDAIH